MRYPGRMFPTMVLTFLLALATGFTSMAFVSRRSHRHYSPVTEELVPPLLFYNLWILLGMSYRFLEASVLAGLTPAAGRLVILGIRSLSMILAIHLGASYLAFTLRATRPDQPQTSLRGPWKAAALASVGMAVLYLVLYALKQEVMARQLSRSLVSLTFLTMALLSLWFFFGTHPAQTGASWRNLRILGAAYSVIFVALTLFIGWSRLSAILPPHLYVTITVSFGIVYNLVTVLWIHFFDRAPQVQAPLGEALPPVRFSGAPLADAYGISKREEEVVRLVCQGLTNQEIADALFISLKTVKDHNYRIFQKTGVRNRVELAQLVRRLTADGEARFASGGPSPADPGNHQGPDQGFTRAGEIASS